MIFPASRQICSRTVLDTSFPGVQFDDTGQSFQSRDFLASVKPTWLAGEHDAGARSKTLERIKARAGNSEYDSILGLSGGLDSSFMLHLAVTEMGLNPLVFHVDGGWNSDGAVRNIAQMVDKLGLDLFTEVIEWREMRDFQLAMFRSGVPHLDIPQDHAFVATLYKFAERHGIRTILNGGNLANEGLRNPLKYFYYGTDMKHIRALLQFSGVGPLNNYPFSPVLRHKGYLRLMKGIEVVKPLNMFRFRKAEAEATLQAVYGWEPFAQKHFESRFTRFYEGYWLPARFDFDPRTVQLSSLILTDQLSREEALEALRKTSLTDEEVAIEFDYVASKLEISSEELQRYLEMPKRYYFDFPNSAGMFEFGARVLHFVGHEKGLKK